MMNHWMYGPWQAWHIMAVRFMDTISIQNHLGLCKKRSREREKIRIIWPQFRTWKFIMILYVVCPCICRVPLNPPVPNAKNRPISHRLAHQFAKHVWPPCSFSFGDWFEFVFIDFTGWAQSKCWLVGGQHPNTSLLLIFQWKLTTS